MEKLSLSKHLSGKKRLGWKQLYHLESRWLSTPMYWFIMSLTKPHLGELRHLLSPQSSFQYLHPRFWSRKTSNGYMDGFLDDTRMAYQSLEDSIYSIKNSSFPHVIIPAYQTKQWVNWCHFTTGPSFLRVIFWQQKNTPSLNVALNVVGKKKLKQCSPNGGEFNGNESHGSLSVLLQGTNPSQGGLSPRVEQLLPRFFFRVKLLLMLQKSQCQPTVGCFWNLVNNGISTTFSSTGFLAGFLVAINSVDAKRRDPSYRAPKVQCPEIPMGKRSLSLTCKHPGFQGRIAKTSGAYLFLVRELHHKPAGSNCTTQYPLDQAEMIIWLVGTNSKKNYTSSRKPRAGS